MNTNKNSYTILYAVVMVVIVALVLAFVSGSLKSRQTANVKMDKKRQILSSIHVNTADGNVDALYNEYITKIVVVNAQGKVISDDREQAFDIDMAKELKKPEEARELPVYIATVDGQQKYILSLRGAGLWGPIWGYIAFNDDKNTVFGAHFSHAGETPALGAEIATKAFQDEFIGKKIQNADHQFVSIAVVKPGKKETGRDYVDGISGGTITSKGVENMLLNVIGQYEPYLTQPSNEAK